MNILRWVKRLPTAISVLALFIMLASATCSHAVSFTIPSGQTETTQQNLDTGETGLIEEGGTLLTPSTAVNIFSSDFVVMKNFGSISAAGTFGIHLIDADNNIISNHGSISAVNEGIVLFTSNNNTLSNYGSIESSGRGFNLVVSHNNTINNHGTISADAFGIVLDNSNNTTIRNYGAISAGTIGIWIVGSENATISNYGGIFAPTAIEGAGNAETLNIFPGSRIVGIINLQGGGDIVNIFSNGAGSSSTLSFTNLGTVINLKGANMAMAGGGVYTVVDPTGQSVNGANLGSMAGGIHNILSRRGGRGFNPPQIAAARVEPGMLPPSSRSQVWASGFGSHRSRGEDGQVLAYDHDYYGGLGGYEMAFGKARVGIMAGYARSETVTDIVSIHTDSDSYFGGVYGQISFGSVNLDMSLLGGYEQHDNDRLVVDNLFGFEVAEADFDSYFLSPSATLSSEFRLNKKIVFRPSATATYSVGWYDSYSESGTTRSNLTIDDRFAQALIGKLQIGAAYAFGRGSEFELRGGARYRYTMNGDISANLAGTSFRYAAAGDDTHFEGLVGANLRIAITNSLNLTIDAEYALSDGIETTISGQAGIEFTF